MIRLVQRRLIIPRGDTGSFAIPAITTSDTDNVAVFSIIDTKTKSLVFQKIVEVSEELITINFTHNDTVNLPAGNYVWDIKFYKSPVYADEELVNGEEIDSYYAGYSLPSCEIRETADKMLMSADAPSAALTAPQLDIISAALASMNDAVSETESNVEHYPRVGENNNWYLWNAETESFVDTGVSASGPGVPEGGTAGQLLKKASAEDFDTEWASETDPTVPAWAKEAQKPTYTAAEVGALPDDTVIPDIQINGTSIVGGNGVANIPLANTEVSGVVIGGSGALKIANGYIGLSGANSTRIKGGTDSNYPLMSNKQHESTFYGLAKAAGDSTQSSSNNNVGVYTDEAKAAIQAMLDVPSNSDLTSAISSLNTMRIHICTAQEYNVETGAPTIQTPDTQTLYLVPGGEGNNLYVEWAYVENAWERFGSADLDLSGYALKTDTVLDTTLSMGRKEGTTIGANSVALGYNVEASGAYSFAIGGETVASQNAAYAEGYKTTASGGQAHAEGTNTIASGSNAHAEGSKTTASGNGAHAEGYSTKASNSYTHAEGMGTTSSGAASHAEGHSTIAFGSGSHAEGYYTIANGAFSHVEGQNNIEDSYESWPEWTASTAYEIGDKVKITTIVDNETTITGYICKNANSDVEFTVANWKKDSQMNFVEIVGNGATSGPRSNARALDWDGNEYLAGDLYVRAENNSTGGVKAATVVDLESKSPAIYKTLANQSVANFTDAAQDIPLQSVVVKLAATQDEITGAISGASAASVIVSSTDNALDGTTYTKTFSDPAVVYGGTYDFVSGTLTITHAIKDLGTAIWNTTNTNTENKHAFISQTLYGFIKYNNDSYDTIANILCSDYDIITVNDTLTCTKGIALGPNYTLYVYDEDYATANTATFKDAMNGVEVLYELSHPTVVQLESSRIMPLNNTTNIWTVDGTVDVTYAVVPVKDVQVKGVSVLDAQGVAEIPLASSSAPGVVRVNSNYGFEMDGTAIRFKNASDVQLKAGTNQYRTISPSTQHTAVFYGLAKAAGDSTQSASENAIGTYTAEAKTAIKAMLGVVDPAVSDVQINGTSIVNNGTANIPIATGSTLGVVKVSGSANFGIGMSSDKDIRVIKAASDSIKTGTNNYFPIVPYNQHEATFYGLAKAAGADMKNIENTTVGIYPDTQKAAIQHMLGTDTNLAPYESDTTADAAYAIGGMFMLNGKLHQATAAIAIGDTLTVGTNCAIVNAASVFPHDVQVNGTSIVDSNGVANIPLIGTNQLGVAQVNATYGIGSTQARYLYITSADSSQIKTGTEPYRPLVPSHQHESIFYGLAKAAGDATQAASSNAVGTYTAEAKAAIRDMLGITNGSFVETVSGSAVTITGTPNTRYVCGEVSSISITPPSAGTIEVYFTSGTSPAVLTLPNTVKMPEWWVDVEANYTYLISITDGVYGAVMLWAD